jgi:hypothetical protein
MVGDSGIMSNYFDFEFSVNAQFRNQLGQYAKNVAEDLHEQMEDLAQTYAYEITEWMQANAVWEDQTYMARESLMAEIESVRNKAIEITLMYADPDVFYGVYLETMQAGRFAILGPAMDEFAPRIAADVRQILATYKYSEAGRASRKNKRKAKK